MTETHDKRTETRACDLISRQASFDALNGIKIAKGANWYEFYHKALTAVGNLPSAQRRISVTERLPENDNDVLVTDGTDCAVAYWRTDAQAWDDSMHGRCDLYGLEVIAWMPLPSPWQGGEE